MDIAVVNKELIGQSAGQKARKGRRDFLIGRQKIWEEKGVFTWTLGGRQMCLWTLGG